MTRSLAGMSAGAAAAFLACPVEVRSLTHFSIAMVAGGLGVNVACLCVCCRCAWCGCRPMASCP